MSQTKAQLVNVQSIGVGNGTTAAPALTGTDTDTGISFGTNEVNISTGGTERVKFDSSGNALINSGSLQFTNSNTKISSPATNTLAFTTNNVERMRISTEGYVTNQQPGIYLDGLDWTSSTTRMHNGYQFWQIGSNWNNTTGIWTCPVAGRYLVAADVQGHSTHTQAGASATYFNILPKINGTAVGLESVATSKGAGGDTGKHDQIGFCVVLNCNANDTIEVFSNHGFRSGTQNHLTIILLG